MKQVMSGLGALALLLVVSPSFGDNWERQMRQQEMMMERQGHMNTNSETRRNYSEIHQNRRMELERGGVQSIEDIENLPSTAAGRPDAQDMEEGANMEDRRKGRRGETDSTY